MQNINEFDTKTQLRLILNDLSTVHILGADSLKYGIAIKTLENVISGLENEQ